MHKHLTVDRNVNQVKIANKKHVAVFTPYLFTAVHKHFEANKQQKHTAKASYLVGFKKGKKIFGLRQGM